MSSDYLSPYNRDPGTPFEQRRKRGACGRDKREWRNTSPTCRSIIRICKLTGKPCVEVARCPVLETKTPTMGEE